MPNLFWQFTYKRPLPIYGPSCAWRYNAAASYGLPSEIASRGSVTTNSPAASRIATGWSVRKR